MKRIIIVFLVCICMVVGMLSGTAFAAKVVDSGECGDDLTWELTGDGVLTISGEGDMYDYYDQSQTWNELPVTAVVIEEGVTSIGENAFEFCSDMESVIIADSVTSIGDCAFSCCKLVEVEIPANVMNIGANPFWGCSSLERITVAEDNPNYYSDESGVLYNKEMTELIQIPWGLSGDYKIKEGVTRIDVLKFEGVKGMTTLTIPKSVELIDELAFDRCISLSAIIVDEDNPYYSSDENGVLYNKDKTNLIYVPCGVAEEITIHPNVTWIAHWAFADAFDSLEVIRFAGDAPTAEDDGLLWWASTVYYPENNPTWTEEVMDSFEYDEEITWIGYEAENTADTDDSNDDKEAEEIIDDTEEIYNTDLEKETVENGTREILFSILRGVGIGLASIAVTVGVVFAVIFVRKRMQKKNSK